MERESQKGYVHAIQKGVDVSEGKILAFMDADCRAPANWVSKILRNFEETPEIVAVGGKLNYFGTHPIFSQTMKSLLFFADALPGNEGKPWNFAT